MADFKKGDTASWDANEVRRGREEQHVNRRHRRRHRIHPLIYILCVLIASAILAGVGWLLMSDLCAFNRGAPIKATVEITAEDTMGTIAGKLEDADLINYKWFFRLFAGFADAREEIGIGTYELNNDMDYRALITGMHSSSGNMNADTVRVTIPEGYTVAQTIELLAKNNVNTAEALTEAAKTAKFDYDFIDNSSGEVSRLEGFLFPDTYDFYVNHDPEGALNKLIKNFERKMTEDRLEQIKASGYSLQEIITVASLIEKETDGSDQNLISSVIYNRLNDNGSHGTYKMLNIDASLLYALPDPSGGISSEDKKLDSRYNLYKYAGLPPTPIANPGIVAIDAALYPTSSDYYYYALGKDGKHHFSKTLEEHNAFLKSGEYGG